MKKFWFILCAVVLSPLAQAAEKRIILIAGRPSHPAGEHEHRAGMLLLQQCLAGVPGVSVEVHSLSGNADAWVPDEAIFDNAAAVIVYSDGGAGHPLLRGDRLQKFAALTARGVGLGLLHYATEPTIQNGQAEFLDWTGGAYEIRRSLNPIFRADFTRLPSHPVARGVKPFSTRDEWYYYIRFRDGMRGVTPILTTIPPLSSLNRPDAPRIGDHEGNEAAWAAVRNREPQHTMWVAERPDGGRGFGFTGGHYHSNWAQDDQRKLVLNAILWVAGVEVPANGVESRVTNAMLRANLDPKGGRGGTPNEAISSLNALLALPRAELAGLRRALTVASLRPDQNPTALPTLVRELAEAEFAAASLRATLFAETQASPQRLGAEEIAGLIQQARTQ